MSLSKEQKSTAYAILILGAVSGAIVMLAELFGHAVGSKLAVSTPSELAIYFAAFSAAGAAVYAKAVTPSR